MTRRITRLLLAIIVIIALTGATVDASQDNQTSQNFDGMNFDFSKLTGPSQMQLNVQAYEEFKRADDSLNKVYRQVLTVYHDDKPFIDELVDAELAWIAFRDAELEAIYPAQDKQGWYGSIFPMTYSIEKADLTWARVKQLKEWLDGMPANPDAGSLVDYSKLSGTQQEMTDIVADQYRQADDTLNAVYRQILTEYQDDKLFIDKLTDAELAWIAFRDAELDAVNTAQNTPARYGHLAPLAHDIEITRLTWARVAQLKEWSEGLPEGVVGLGSRKIRRE